MSKHNKYSSYKKGKKGHDFRDAPTINAPRSSFNRSHSSKTTFSEGMLTPIYVDEVLPGDTFNLEVTAFIRMATPISPIFDNLHFYTYFFFVPTRLIWDNWKAFCGETKNTDDTTDYEIPTLTVGPHTFQAESLFDYFGLPTQVPINGSDVSSLPLRAGVQVYNDWFRPEYVQSMLNLPTGDGPDDPSLFEVERACKVHDYFTSALPFAQKGDPVPIPGLGPDSVSVATTLDREAGVYAAGFTVPNAPAGTQPVWLTGGDLTDSSDHVQLNTLLDPPGGPLYFAGGSQGFTATSVATVHPQHTATINQLREAFQTQELLEQFARAGTRYTEILRSLFGVKSPDARLQRAEFLGSGHGTLDVSQVPKTSTTDATSPQGNLAAFAFASLHKHGFKHFFEEHGYTLGYVMTRADLTYQQGLHPMWSRRHKLHFYWPALANLGEQPILNQELVMTDNQTTNKAAWGYQEAWANYRFRQSFVTGKFRSNTPGGSLDSWHLAQFFSVLPSLSLGFLQENAPMARIEAVHTEPDFIADFYFNYVCARPMPTYSVPGLTSRF